MKYNILDQFGQCVNYREAHKIIYTEDTSQICSAVSFTLARLEKVFYFYFLLVFIYFKEKTLFLQELHRI